MNKKRMLLGYLLLVPFVMHFIIFVVYPIIMSTIYSMTNYNMLYMTKDYIGFRNYLDLFKDETFRKAIVNTAVYVLIDGTGVVVFGLLMALVLNLKLRKIGLFRTIYYLPVVVDWVIVSIVIMFILDPSFGIANYLLRSLNLPPQKFLQSSQQALVLIALSSIWKGVGYYAIFYLAALQEIPESLVEAAKIDGANSWHRFVNITLPQIAPISLFVVIMASIGSLKGFDQFYIMTKGGPARATTTIMMYFYENAFGYMDIGYGASIAILFTLMVFVFIFVQRMLLSRMRGASGNN